MNSQFIHIYNNLIKLTTNKNLYADIKSQDQFSDRITLFLLHFAFFLKNFKSDQNKKDDLQHDEASKEEVVVEQAVVKEDVVQESYESQEYKTSKSGIYAGPAVRKLAREFGINLNEVLASGPRNRILKEDLHKFVKSKLKDSSSGIPKAIFLLSVSLIKKTFCGT